MAFGQTFLPNVFFSGSTESSKFVVEVQVNYYCLHSHLKNEKKSVLQGQYHAIFSNTLKIERRYSVDSSQDMMTKIPLKDYQNAKKLSTDVFAGR